MTRTPLKATKRAVARDTKRFGTMPEEVVNLYANRKEQGAECEAACDAILAENPEHGVALIYKATMADERKDWASVLKYSKRMTEAMPMIFPAWNLRGRAEVMLGQPIAARESFMSYCDLQPHDLTGACMIAITFVMEKKIDLALYFLDRLSETEGAKDKAQVLWFRALIEEHAGDPDSALMHFIESQILGDDETKSLVASRIHSLLFLKPDPEKGEG